MPTSPGDGAAPPSDVITVTNEEFRSLPLPASELKMQQPVEDHPYYAMSLVGERTHQWAESSEHGVETTVLGTAVKVRATPLEYWWDDGHGVARTAAGPGARRPEQADPETDPAAADVVYEGTGHLEVQLTTVWKIESRLVAEGCDTNSTGWACGDDVWQTTPPWLASE
ncbi:hypothetical protein [Zhihengliuella flava]|uniref:Uncharacterized protein n=1 Tax=Zhihengliuella flava TaxID=1285193 RepID=A0A931DDI7_9MICC|nr:hypothetical protein [Zhihengliuella flava]MBG6085481.1 hypothetical protein [Zhihengliuella flava]